MFQIKVVQKIQTQFYAKELFPENRTVYEIMWKKHGAARQATGKNIRCMHFACWITKTEDTHSEYVTPITFPRQRWLRKRVSILRYTYNARRVFNYIIIRNQMGSSV
jgi:hypothetical protein